MRLTVIADGDSTQKSTNSGVPLGLITGLSHTAPNADIVTVNGRLAGIQKAWAVTRAVTHRSFAWRAEFLFGRVGLHARSAMRDRVLAEMGDAGHVLHVRNV